MADIQPKWDYPKRHPVTGLWPEPAMHWQRPPRPMYIHIRNMMASCFKVPNVFVVASALTTFYVFSLGNTSEDDMKLSRLGNSDFLDERAFFEYGTYHSEPGMLTATQEAKQAAKAAAAAAAAGSQH